MLVAGLHRSSRVVREPGSVKSLVGVRVLVVDDDAEARVLLESVLSYCGALVTLAASPPEALDCLETSKPDVVIVDVVMPEEDGAWLMREIWARARGGRVVPVVALAAGPKDGPDLTVTAGFKALLRKPVNPWELCRLVATLAGKA